MKYPIVGVLIFFIFGTLFGQYFAKWAYTVLFVVFGIGILYSLFHKSIIGVFLIIGFLLGNTIMYFQNVDSVIINYADKNTVVLLKGKIVNTKKTSSGNKLYVLKAESVSANGNTEKCRDKLYVYGESGFFTGNTVFVQGKVNSPKVKHNPSDFDQYKYYKAQNISCNISGKIVYVSDNTYDINAVMSNLRDYFSGVIYRIMPEKYAGIVNAMVLGTKDNLEDEIFELYKDAGVVHILAISGLHISVFAGGLLFVLNRFSKRTAPFMLMIFMALYCFFTGLALSTVRAVFMIYVLQIGHLLYKKYNIITSASVACIMLLLINPNYIFDMGFQYSFGCVFTIGMTIDVIRKYNIKNKFARSLLTAFFVGLTSKIISAYHFYNFNPIDIISNMIIIPCMAFVLPVCIVSVISGCFSDVLGSIIMKIAILAFDFFEFVCRIISETKISNFYTGGFPAVLLIPIFLFLIMLYKLAVTRELKFVPIVLLSVLLCFAKPSNYTGVDIISSGQGECTFIKNGDYVALVNAGKNGNSKTADKIIIPYMKYNNINKINDVFITSSENYVIGGLYDLIDEIHINNIYLPLNIKNSEKLEKLLLSANKQNTKINYISQDTEIDSVENLKYKCYYVYSGSYGKLSVKVSFDGTDIFFPTNISNKGDRALFHKDIKSNILILSKNGNKKANTSEFITAVNPENAVVSTAYENNERCLEAAEILSSRNIPLYNTEKDGMITIKIKDGKYKIKKYIGGDIFAEYR